MRATASVVLTLAVGVGAVGAGVAYVALNPPARSALTTSLPEAQTLVAHPGPITVTWVTPQQGATGVPSDTAIAVHFAMPLASSVVDPTLSPPVAGSWQQLGAATLQFTPQAPLVPGSTETVSLPQGQIAGAGRSAQTLAQPFSAQFTVAPGSTLRLQQLLAQLGYLPVTWTPSTTTPASPAAAASPQPGNFAWRWPSTPPALEALWQPGADNVMVQGAVMAFENDNGLTTDGIPGPQVWTALLADAAAGKGSSFGYSFVLTSKALPETLNLWHDGQIAVTSPANTGIPASPTPDGTWPVYLRYRTTTMSGVNPDGTPYHDTGVPWVSYFHGGDAVHGFLRASYGSQQSLGCVELPYAVAGQVWPLMEIGTLVSVTG